MPSLFDRVKETSTTTGTGMITLGGSPTGFRNWSSVLNAGDQSYYVIEDSLGNWECGLGAMFGTNQILRASVTASSSGGVVVNFPAGNKYVWQDATASALNYVCPVGAMLDFAGSVVPTGWLACDGSAVSRTTYAALFAVIGTTWGSGDGSTTFNVPDLRGRTAVGSGTGSGLTARTLAATGGEETHQLTTTEMPSHTHSMVANADIVAIRNTTGGANTYPSGLSPLVTIPQNTGSAGSNGAHNNMQPFVVTTKIIKA